MALNTSRHCRPSTQRVYSGSRTGTASYTVCIQQDYKNVNASFGVQLPSAVSEVGGYIYLQRYENGSWKTIGHRDRTPVRDNVTVDVLFTNVAVKNAPMRVRVNTGFGNVYSTQFMR